MKGFGFWFCVAAVYTGFFAAIGVSVWVTGSAWPLFALILIPNIKYRGDSK